MKLGGKQLSEETSKKLLQELKNETHSKEKMDFVKQSIDAAKKFTKK